jgi:hypothetical protein
VGKGVIDKIKANTETTCDGYFASIETRKTDNVLETAWKEFELKKVNEKPRLCLGLPKLNSYWHKLEGSILNGEYSAEWSTGQTSEESYETSNE